MLSISTARTAGGAEAYYLHLEQEGADHAQEYYAKDGAGVWMGTGAHTLGLRGQDVTRDHFRALAQGFNPKTGEAMVQNAGDPERRAGWDLTFSAPKTVSALWAVADDEMRRNIEGAHSRAVGAGFSLVEQKAAAVRVGKEGQFIEGARLIAAAFQHGTSREQEPQLHTHVFTYNQGERADGRYASLDSRQLFEWKMAAGAAYQAQLAYELQTLGFTVDRANSGEACRVAGVPQSLADDWSTRRGQIVALMNDRGESSAAAAAAAAVDTRKVRADVDAGHLQQAWAKAAHAHGFDAAKVRELAESRPQMSAKLGERGHCQAGTEDVLQAATEHKAIIKEADIYLHSMRACIAVSDASQGHGLAERAKTDAISIEKIDGHERKPQLWTTHELMRAERLVVSLAKDRLAETRNVVSIAAISLAIQRTEVAKGYLLNQEQRTAVANICGEAGGVRVMVGDAGTGKSTTLHAVREAYQAQGCQVIGATISNKAAAELQQSAGIDSRSVSALIYDLKAGREHMTAKTVLVVDEAGMVDSRAMRDLMQAADRAGAKVILAGDHKQLQPVGAGATFPALAKLTHASTLENNTRQHENWARQAVKDMSQGEAAKALSAYIERNAVTVSTTHKTGVEEVAARYLKDVREVGNKEAIAIAGTNQAVRDINQAVRDQLKAQGQLLGEQTLATKRGQINVSQGDRLLVRSNTAQAKNGDLVTVTAIKDGQIQATIDRSAEIIMLDPKRVDLQHGFAMTTHMAQGLTVDRATVYTTAQTSREMAYVQASRARETTHFVTTVEQVKKMEIQALPTERMTMYARDAEAARLARGEAPALNQVSKTSFMEIRKYLDTYSPQSLGVVDCKNHMLERLKEVANAMSQERQKESTLDYQPVTERSQPAREFER